MTTSSAQRAEVSLIVHSSETDDEKYGALKRLRTFCAELCVTENNSPVLEPGLLLRDSTLYFQLCDAIDLSIGKDEISKSYL